MFGMVTIFCDDGKNVFRMEHGKMFWDRVVKKFGNAMVNGKKMQIAWQNILRIGGRKFCWWVCDCKLFVTGGKERLLEGGMPKYFWRWGCQKFLGMGWQYSVMTSPKKLCHPKFLPLTPKKYCHDT